MGGGQDRHGARWRARTCIGAISGTSMDAIDVAVLRTDGQGAVEPLGSGAHAYPPDLRARLMQVAAAPALARDAAGGPLEREVADAFAIAIRAVVADLGLDLAGVELVGCHGQTVWHAPERQETIQLADCQHLAATLGVAVVGDFRRADVAAGGQGAPLAPLYHAALAAGHRLPLAFLNLGGVGNLTHVSKDGLLAFDTGPANALLDDFVRERTGAACDRDGTLAAQGDVHQGIVDRFCADPFLARPPPKSLDRFHFSRWLDEVAGLSDADGAATLAALTVASVVAAIPHLPSTPLAWYVAGGGRHNRHVLGRLAAALAVPVQPVEAIGARGDALEAEAFAYLAARSVRGLPLSLPGTTGVPQPMPGGRLHLPACDRMAK